MKKRMRAVAIIFLNGGIVLIHRKNLKYRKPSEYYVLPGVLCDQEENIKEKLQKEVLKVIGLNVIPQNLVFHIETEHTKEYFYLCEYISGKFFDLHSVDEKNEVYMYAAKSVPEIIRKEELTSCYLLPEGIKDKLLKKMNWDSEE